MFHKKIPNAKPYNWLIHKICHREAAKFSEHYKGRVLDVGCGSMPYESIIKKNAQEYVGLDRHKAVENKDNFVLGTAESLPFSDESFDTVTAFQLLEHLPQPSAFIKEAYRVLKPGGKIIVSTPFMWGIHDDPHDYYRFTHQGLNQKLSENRFQVVSVRPAGGFWTVWILMLNYFLLDVFPGRVRFLLRPAFFLLQTAADFLDTVSLNLLSNGKRYCRFYAIFSAVAVKEKSSS